LIIQQIARPQKRKKKKKKNQRQKEKRKYQKAVKEENP